MRKNIVTMALIVIAGFIGMTISSKADSKSNTITADELVRLLKENQGMSVHVNRDGTFEVVKARPTFPSTESELDSFIRAVMNDALSNTGVPAVKTESLVVTPMLASIPPSPASTLTPTSLSVNSSTIAGDSLSPIPEATSNNVDDLLDAINVLIADANLRRTGEGR